MARRSCGRQPVAWRRIAAVAVVVGGGLLPAACAAATEPPAPAAPRQAAAETSGGRAAVDGPDGGGRDARRALVEFPHGRRFAAEIADTPDRWARGYMFRREIGEGEAMIFVFPEAGFHPFWMKNTLVPLDMIWMDEAFTVMHVQDAAPPCRRDPCPSYGPPRKARYVLEVRGGIAAREGLAIGDRLRISFPQPAD